MAWPTEALADLCSINIGRTPSRAESAYWGPGYPWLSIADMNQGRDLQRTKEQITPLAATKVMVAPTPSGTVMLSFKLSIGKVGISSIPLYTNEAIASLPILDSNKLLADYLYWALRSIDFSNDTDRAAMGQTLNKAKLRQISVPVPPIDSQRRIVDVLDRAEGLRIKQRFATTHLGDLAESVFIDMFSGGTWPTVAMRDVSSLITKGTTPTSVGLKFETEGVPFLRVQDLVAGVAVPVATTLHISKESHQILKRSKIASGDVLVSIAGTIGRIATVPDGLPEMNCNQAVAIVRPTPNLDSVFAANWLRTDDAKRQMKSGAVTATIANLSLQQVGGLQIPHPPVALQHAFAEQVARIETIAATQHERALELGSLFDSLQHRAFAGRL